MPVQTLLKKSRLNADMTQKEVAKKIGILREMYCNIENGKVNGTVDTWIDISELFGVSVNDIRIRSAKRRRKQRPKKLRKQ